MRLDMTTPDQAQNLQTLPIEKKEIDRTKKPASVSMDDFNFASDATASMLQRSPKGGRIMLYTILLFMVVFFVWASHAEVDEVERGQGKVIPSSQIQVVQNLEGGIVKEILISEGQIVVPGQILLRIDDTRFGSSLRENQLKLLSLQIKAARLKAEANGEDGFKPAPEVIEKMPELAREEEQLFHERIGELRSNIAVLKEQVIQRESQVGEMKAKLSQTTGALRLAEQELDLTEPLIAQGAVSEVEVLRLKRQINGLRGEVTQARLSIPRLKSSLDEAQRKIEEINFRFQSKAREEYNAVATELATLSESGSALQDRFKRTSVRSPVRGTVKQLLINTVGGVVQPGMDLLEIVPLEDSLLIEARLKPQDIAFLRPGLKAIVKFTAYDYAIYGGLDGKVEQISADTIVDDKGESYYLVKVRTDQSFLGEEDNPLPIIPGMVADVDVLTGKKTILDFLLKPVLRARQNALRER